MKAWRKLKGRRQDIYGDISPESMYTYVKHLYDHENAKEMPTIEESLYTQECFDSHAMFKGVKKLANGKASDTLHLCSEMLKRSGNLAKMWIHALLNQAISH